MRKDTYLSESTWKDSCRVEVNIEKKTRLPLEIKVHRKLLDTPAFRIFVDIQSNFVDHPTTSYRMYLEFCPHGDLDDLIARYGGTDL